MAKAKGTKKGKLAGKKLSKKSALSFQWGIGRG
jgi:hypothetical protein